MMAATEPPGASVPVALLSYSTRPRGGVVHTLWLTEALHAAGSPVHLYVIGDPAVGLYRPTSAPHTVFPAAPSHPTLDERVFAAIDALEAGLMANLPEDVRILHAQDCISARAAVRIRARRPDITVLRTVHHIDDFTSPSLVDCQDASIREPDQLVVVSRYWQQRLEREYGLASRVVTNGVDAERFARPPADGSSDLRARIGATGRPLFLSVGGLEPRKGGRELVEAFAIAREELERTPKLAVVGGHSFQDHAPYRQRCLERADELGIGDDLVLVGTVAEEELPGWYQTADIFVLPSVNEGWGLVVLEALAASLPVIVSDLPVFQEYLSRDDVVMVPARDADTLAAEMVRVARDPELRRVLALGGPAIAQRYGWDTTARQHMAVYGSVTASVG